MSFQAEFKTAFELALEHNLQVNGLGAENCLTDLNNTLSCTGRQLLVFSDVVIEVESDDEGKLQRKMQFTEDNAASFGKFAGFTNIETNYFDENYDELFKTTLTGVLIKKNFTKQYYSFVPVSKIRDFADVYESVEVDEVSSEIIYLLANENPNLIDLANLVSKSSRNYRDVTVLKSYLQSVVMPEEFCHLIAAPKFIRTKHNMFKSNDKTHVVHDSYRLSIIIDETTNTPVLCFEDEEDDGSSSSIILLRPKEKINYTKL